MKTAPSAEKVIRVAAAVALLAAPSCGDRTSSTRSELPDSVPVVENDATGAHDLDSAWTATVELEIGTRTGGGPESFGHVVDVAVDALGRIWVLDRQASEIRVFGPDGDFVRRVGGEGQGPGEFGDPLGVDVSPDGEIWVLDVGNQRISVHDTAGRYLDQLRRFEGARSGYHTGWTGGFDARGRYWDLLPAGGRNEWAWIVSRPDSALVAVDTVPVPEREAGPGSFRIASGAGVAWYSVPFAPSASWDVHGEGVRVMSPGSPYELRWLAADGTTLRVARKPWEPVSLSEEDRKEVEEPLARIRKRGGDPDASRVPDHKPAVQSLFVEPSGRVWVDPYEQDEGTVDRTFDVFSPDGRYLGPFTLPVAIRTRPRPVFRDGRMYAVHVDEVGVHHVVVVRLDRPAADDA